MEISKARYRHLALILLCLHQVYPTRCSSQPISVRASAGVVQLPLSDWSNFWENLGSGTFYEKNNPNLYYSLSIYYSLSDNHYLELGSELIKSSASLAVVDNRNFSGSVIIDWQFQGVPITLGYEYRFHQINEFFRPALGLGVSYFFSEVTGTESISQFSSKRTGNGYGAHVSAAIISRLSESLRIVNKVRYRYSNGTAFSDSREDIHIEFTGFDISLGLDWAF